MKLEIDLAAEQQKLYSIPVREQPLQPPVTREELLARRRTVRVSTDDLIGAGFLAGDLVRLSAKLGDTMLVMGGTCAQLGVRPEISEFLLAAKELVEDARTVVDKSLTVQDWEQVKIGVAMMQVVLGGVCFVLNLPYRDVLQAMHGAYMVGGAPSEELVREVLRRHGFPVDPPVAAVNEGQRS